MMLLHMRIAGLAAALAAAPVLAASHPFTVVATTYSSPPPGAAAGQYLISVSAPAINNSGAVAFTGTLGGTGITDANRSGIWSGTADDLSLIMRGGEAAPGTDGALFHYPVPGIAFNDAGQVLFDGILAHGGDVTAENDRGLWLFGPGGDGMIVAREGAPIPGEIGRTFGSAFYSGQGLAENGHVGFLTQVEPSARAVSGVFGGDAAALQTIASEGMPAPGLDGWTFLTFGNLRTNRMGGVTFRAYARSGTKAFSGLWAGSPSDPALVVKWGDPVADAPGLVHGQMFNSGTLTSGGYLLFQGSLESAETFRMVGSAIFAGPPEDLRTVARTGQPAPGTGAEFASLSVYPVISSTNRFAFGASLRGEDVDETNDSGLWTGTPDSLRLLVREGDPAPGAGGALFGDFQHDSFIWISDNGTGAFRNILTGPGVTSFNRQGPWTFDATGRVNLVVRTGDVFEINGVNRTITGIATGFASGGDDGQNRPLASAGNRLAFKVILFGGYEAVLVTDLPEPAQPGDANRDGRVDGEDFLIWQARFGMHSGAAWEDGDFNGDGRVDGEDFLIWQSAFGAGGALAAIPEPAASLLLLAGGVLIGRQRRI